MKFAFATNTERLTTTVAELNAQVEAGTPPAALTNIFIETTTPETFASLFAQLVPSLQEVVTRLAKNNAANFDECIAWSRDRGLYTGGWLGFRDWARAQPWFPDALAKAEYYKAQEVPYEVEQAREIAFLEGELSIAKSDEERADLARFIEAIRRDMARAKAKDQ